MVKITNVSYDKGESKGLSKLELTITGPEINNTILNTIRRTILSDIPIFAWTAFKFTVNTSVFHNNFIKNYNKLFIRSNHTQYTDGSRPVLLSKKGELDSYPSYYYFSISLHRISTV